MVTVVVVAAAAVVAMVAMVEEVVVVAAAAAVKVAFQAVAQRQREREREEEKEEEQRWLREGKRERGKTARGGDGEGGVSLWLNTAKGARQPSSPAASGPTDTMLRLNIRCLNNQARFDPAKERKKEERRRRRTVRGPRALDGGKKEEAIPVPTRVGMEHVPRRSSFSIRARSSRLPLAHRHPLRLCLTLRRLSTRLSSSSSSSSLPPLSLCCSLFSSLFLVPRLCLHSASSLATLTVSVYTYYAKRVTVGGLGSRTRAV